MECPRLKHFRRVNSDGTIGICGHMIFQPKFNTLEESDAWVVPLQSDFANNEWPSHCKRCKDTEESGRESIRNFSQKRHTDLVVKNTEYLTVGGVLDTYCNSACLSCSATLSTRIASLNKSPFVQDNYQVFTKFPQDRIYQLDINGGEPSYSKNYQKILQQLPPNLTYLRINTNGHKVMPNIEKVLDKQIDVNVTLSLDGVGDVHDYVRWPVKWKNYTQTVDSYINLQKKYQNLTLDFWTTLSSLNLNNLIHIISYAKNKGIPHGYALLEKPHCLSIKKTNWLTKQYQGNESYVATEDNNDDELNEFLVKQEKLRKISRIQELAVDNNNNL